VLFGISGPDPGGNLCFLEVRNIIFKLFLGPPSPGGSPGEGPDYHVLKEIVGFGAIPARILRCLIMFFGPVPGLAEIRLGLTAHEKAG
jgi:hypothetical protein